MAIGGSSGPVTAYLGFGGNIGAVAARIIAAWDMLQAPPIIDLIGRSMLYRTVAVGGPPGQDDYINAACCVSTTLPARSLLERCLAVERRFGRERRERWGPRTLDIDILIYGDAVIDEPGLCVPHPRLRERLFVLVPLADVAPDGLKLPPDGSLLSDVLASALTMAGETAADWRERVVG